MSVNLISHRCFVCDAPMTLTSSTKCYHVSGLKDILLSENPEKLIEKSTKYTVEFLHYGCRSKIIKEISSKNKNIVIF